MRLALSFFAREGGERSAEAIVRWCHERNSPPQFSPEKYGVRHEY